jgi:hypothetical protein
VNLDEYRALFFGVALVLTLVVASPAFTTVLSFQDSSGQFTELWLLGPDHITDNYPFEVGAGETYKIFVDVANHIGHSEYYLIKVKFGNITQSSLENGGSKPSSLSPLYEFQLVVDDENICESSVDFEFQDLSFIENSVTVGDIVINGISFPVDASASWDSYFKLFFELWRYDVGTNDFTFTGQFVGIRLDVTDA